MKKKSTKQPEKPKRVIAHYVIERKIVQRVHLKVSDGFEAWYSHEGSSPGGGYADIARDGSAYATITEVTGMRMCTEEEFRAEYPDLQNGDLEVKS